MSSATVQDKIELAITSIYINGKRRYSQKTHFNYIHSFIQYLQREKLIDGHILRGRIKALMTIPEHKL